MPGTDEESYENGRPAGEFRSALQGLVTDLATGEQLSYVPAMPRPGFFYEYLRPGHTNRGVPKSGWQRQLPGRSGNGAHRLGQTTWESFFSDAADDSELAKKVALRKQLEAELAAMQAAAENLTRLLVMLPRRASSTC